MHKFVMINGRLMQHQPVQQQQGAALMNAPAPGSRTILPGPDRQAGPPRSGDDLSGPSLSSLPTAGEVLDWFKESRPPHWIEAEKRAHEIHGMLSAAFPKSYPPGVRFKVETFNTDILYPPDTVRSEAVDLLDKKNRIVAISGRWLDDTMKRSPDDYHADMAVAIAHGVRHLTQSWSSWIMDKSGDSPAHEKIDADAVNDMKALRPSLDAYWRGLPPLQPTQPQSNP